MVVIVATAQHPWLVRQLIAAIIAEAPEFRFTAIIVNHAFASRPHVDRGNLGDSYTVALGDFEGGEFRVEDGSGPELCKL